LNKQITIAFLFLFVCAIGNAQNPVSRNLTNQNGLPSNTVYNILQDSKGFIWLGHDKGLSRYDGNTFTHFTAPAQQGKSVSNLVEFNNAIWCQDFSGNFYYTQNDQLIKENNFTYTSTYSPAGIIKGNTFSVINYDSIRSYNIEQKKKNKFILQKNTRQAVYHAKNFSYFFCSRSLKRFNGEIVETLQTYKDSMPSFNFLTRVKNQFYAFTRSYFPLVFKVNQKNIEPLAVLRKGLLIQDVTVIDNQIWISTTSGAYCFDENMQPLYNGQCFFEQNSITKIIKDRENNYWFGTLNKGLLIVSDLNVKLYKYSTESITALSPYNNSNEILAGTSSNLIFSFNSQTNQFNTLITNETKGEVFSLLYDKPLQTIIASSTAINFYKNEIKTKEENIAGKNIVVLNNDNYVAAFSGGITILPRKNNIDATPPWLIDKLKIVGSKKFLTQGFRGRAVLFDTATQTLYTATSQGLQYYNKSGSKLILLNNKPIFASCLTICNNALYIGTFSDGLVRIKNNIAEYVNTKNKTITNSIYKLYTDNNNIWINSDELIQRYNTINDSITNFTAADGLPKAEIKDILIQNGKAYIATTDGLVVFNTDKNPLNKVKPLLQLNKFLVNDIVRSIDSTTQLKSTENNIDLVFSLLAFKDNETSIISYRINKEEWKTLAKGLRSLQLASLAPGKYSIELNAINEDGVAAEKNIIVNFLIDSPFYKKIWFYVLVAGLFFLAMYLYFKQRLRSEKRNNELMAQKMQLEQELHQSMLSSIKSQMNPHFLFNALNTVQSYIYTNEKENASLYLGKFSELTRTILDMSNKERISLAEEIKALQLYIELEQLRFEDKLEYTFTIDKKISTETSFIPSMLIQPYVENAIKHGLMHQKNKWLLNIIFNKKENAVEVIIDDNGVGRKASEAINLQKLKKHQSFATGANQKRLEILNKGLQKEISLQIIDKEDDYGNPTGTTMILNIPFVGAT
jgi:sensor histidine kinase YesM